MSVPDRYGCTAAFHRLAGSHLQFLLALALWVWPAAAGAREPIRFDIVRSGDVIGTHAVTFDETEQGQRIVVDIAIAVKLLGITVYRYTHRNEEVWRDGRLVSINSKTDNDGSPDFVRGRAIDGVLRIEGSEAAGDLPADTPSTNYWNTDLVRRTGWLNSQTGKLLQVTVTPKGAEEVAVPAGTVRATRYGIAGDLKIDLWYAADGAWVKCVFTAQDGSLIEYRRR